MKGTKCGLKMVAPFCAGNILIEMGLMDTFPLSMIGRKGESLRQKQDTFHASIYFAAVRKTVTKRHATHPILQFLKYT